MLERVETHGTEGIARPSDHSEVTIVLDFDGTITIDETLDLLVAAFGDREAHAGAVAGLGAGVALRDVVAQGYGSLRASPDEVREWLLERVRFRPGFGELVDLARARGWRLVILSSGLRDLIEPLLEREGIGTTELLSNERVGSGWEIAFRDDSICDVCGEQCKRGTVVDLRSGGTLVYVGDGYSDGCGSLVADRVFARRRLATFLDERGVGYVPFADFHEIVRDLA